MKTAIQQSTVIRQFGLLRVKSLAVKVQVVDVRSVPFMPERWLVRPVDGKGAQWVNATQVELLVPPAETDFEDDLHIPEVTYA